MEIVVEKSEPVKIVAEYLLSFIVDSDEFIRSKANQYLIKIMEKSYKELMKDMNIGVMNAFIFQ